MAEYYPLLAKAVGSLPNSTPDTRRVVYERARKALIGQLRTLHPPIPDEDIERESVELDRAIERIEGELATSAARPQAVAPSASTPTAPAPAPGDPPGPAKAPAAVVKKPLKPLRPAPPSSGTLGPPAKPFTPLRTKIPTMKPPEQPDQASADKASAVDATPGPAPSASKPIPAMPATTALAPLPATGGDAPPRPPADRAARLEVQRPIAPQPPGAKGPKRQMWIIWVGIGVVVAIVAGTALKLRDHPSTVARTKTPEPQTQSDSGKIADRVGETPSSPATAPETPSPSTAPEPPTGAEPQAAAPAAAPPTNPEVPVAQRAALLVEAPDQPNKVKTYLGTVVWKFNNVSEGTSDAGGPTVEADIDMPDDKLKVVVTFEKNTDSSLPASHTIRIHFIVQPGSATGDVQNIGTPQLRREDSPNGDSLAGVTVPTVQDSFLVGLSPGNAETANLELLRTLQWIDIPMTLTNGHVAKLTFEKGSAGDRAINDAIAAWQKQ